MLRVQEKTEGSNICALGMKITVAIWFNSKNTYWVLTQHVPGNMRKAGTETHGVSGLVELTLKGQHDPAQLSRNVPSSSVIKCKYLRCFKGGEARRGPKNVLLGEGIFSFSYIFLEFIVSYFFHSYIISLFWVLSCVGHCWSETHSSLHIQLNSISSV